MIIPKKLNDKVLGLVILTRAPGRIGTIKEYVEFIKPVLNLVKVIK